ncbi:hypothetical protein FACS1894110_18320 [Spirochaetia bacterium]|nr:hypothetical protein FACS1894110_18320 [Spirochaetia bacterium]
MKAISPIDHSDPLSLYGAGVLSRLAGKILSEKIDRLVSIFDKDRKALLDELNKTIETANAKFIKPTTDPPEPNPMELMILFLEKSGFDVLSIDGTYQNPFPSPFTDLHFMRDGYAKFDICIKTERGPGDILAIIRTDGWQIEKFKIHKSTSVISVSKIIPWEFGKKEVSA